MQYTTQRKRFQTGALLGLSIAAIAIGAHGCGATGHAHGRGTPVIHRDIKPSNSIGNDESAFEVNGGPGRAGECVEVTWTDSSGAEISTDTIQADGSGSASGQVPPGAVRWEAKVADCEDPEAPAGIPWEATEHRAGLAAGGGRTVVHAGPAYPVEARVFHVFGSPIIPSDDPGETNLSYAFRVIATSFDEAEDLVAPIVAGGIGTPVPEEVEVLLYSTMEAVSGGARLVQAQPGSFEEWTFEFNVGVFLADLFTNSLHYDVGTWDVVETVIPLSAFDFGILPGATYLNTGAADYRTDRMSETLSAGYQFDFSN